MSDVALALRWAGDLRFEGGRIEGPSIVIDGANAAGPSPVESLLLALAGCMAADLVEIALKMRVPIASVGVRAEGDRAVEPPRRYTRIALHFAVGGTTADDEPKLQRALDLSRERYCSVWHTLRPDLPIEISLERE
jgi:putative redox protein